MASDKKNQKNTNKKPISKVEKLVYTLIVIVLVIAIVLVSVLVLYPKLAGRPDWHIKAFLDFEDSEWIEEMVEGRIEPTDKVLEMSSSFVYSADTAFITTVYGSSANIAQAKEYYLNSIDGAVDYEADSVSNMHISGQINGEKIEVVNYAADILNGFDTQITINKQLGDFLKDRLIEAYPSDIVSGYEELDAIMQNEKLGGYVMYNDDELSSYSYPGVPIYSEAYRYSGSKEDLISVQQQIKEKYISSVYFEGIDTVYFMNSTYILSLSISQSDINLLAVITIQEIPEEELAKMQ